ncbi:MAG: hypothetical protein MI807_04805 [Verrucomicrobiales bacterium]|nr:hypothetical protein [Verrucomicrobiales bacterium]
MELPNEQTDPRFIHLNRWSFLMMQCFEAAEFLGFAKAEGDGSTDAESKMRNVLRQQAFFRSFLLSYGKCFASSGPGRASLDPSKVYAGMAEILKTHNEVMKFRNKFAAHSDESGLDEAAIRVTEFKDRFEISHVLSVLTPMGNHSKYTDLLDALDIYIITQLNKHLDSLEFKLGKKIRLHEGNQDIDKKE